MRMTKITRIIRTLGIGALAMGMLLASPVAMQASAPFVTPVMPVSQPAPVQHRFTHSYDFETGMNYRNDLGRSTAFHGNVLQNVFTANVRRDANVSFRPPSVRIGNVITHTDPNYWSFSRTSPTMQNGFWNPTIHQDTNMLPIFDVNQHGVNAQPQGNQMNIQTNVQTSGASQGGSGGFLPPTSMGN